MIFWAHPVNWLSFHFPRLQRVLKAPALPLVREGRMLRKNMAKELITEDELWSQLRLQGVEQLSEVEAAYLEPDGRVSVVGGDRSKNGRQGARPV